MPNGSNYLIFFSILTPPPSFIDEVKKLFYQNDQCKNLYKIGCVNLFSKIFVFSVGRLPMEVPSNILTFFVHKSDEISINLHQSSYILLGYFHFIVFPEWGKIDDF